jgi:hypothetical protein
MDEHRKARALICVLMQSHGYNTEIMCKAFISRRNKNARNYDCNFCTKYISDEMGYTCYSCRCIFHFVCVRRLIYCSNEHIKARNYVMNQKSLCEVRTWYSPALIKNWHKCVMCGADICDSVKLKCDQEICHVCLKICDHVAQS